MNASDNREQLKQKYKKHYKELLETKKQLRDLEQSKRSAKGVGGHFSTSSDLVHQMEELITKVKHRAALIESKVEVALDSLKSDDNDHTATFEQQDRKQRARDTINQIKSEMGQLYSEMETQARNLEVEKTVGVDKPSKTNTSNSSPTDTT